MTRPEQQAMPLCRLLEAHGASTLRLPAIDIKGCGDPGEARARIGALDAYAFVIFTSANAVRFGHSFLDRRGGFALGAIGPATARALVECGHDVSLRPQQGFTSEALLADIRLQNLTDQRVLLIKGADGRPMLEQELIRRGAEVVAVDVYQRIPAIPSARDLATVQAELTAGRLHVVTATSLDIGKRLLEAVPPVVRAQLQGAQWLVPGERVAAALREYGLHAPMLQASSAEDEDLVKALLRWRSVAP